MPPGRGARAGGVAAFGEAESRKEGVAQVAGVDHVVVAEPVGRGDRGRACSAAARARSSGSSIALAGDDAGSAPRVIDGNASVRVWPSNGFIAMIDEPKPNALRSGDVQLRDLEPVLHREHAGRMAQDALLLGRRAGEDTGVVGQEDARQAEGAGDVEEVRGLVGGVAVDRARADVRVVRDDRHAAPTEVRERGDDRATEAGLDLEQLAAVDQRTRARDGWGRDGAGRAG